MSKKRLEKLRKILKDKNLDGYISSCRSELTHSADVRYLTGFTGDTGIFVMVGNKGYLIVDSRFHTQAEDEATGVEVVKSKSQPHMELDGIKELQEKNIRIGFDPDLITCQQKKMIEDKIPDVILIPSEKLVGQISTIKNQEELKYIKKAIYIAETALERVLNLVKPGIPEIELAAELEYQMKMLGSSQPAFHTIVASGHRSALPHGVASTKKIDKGDFVTFDFGATYKGYVSDITRTIVVGKATSKQKRIYNTVLKAQKAAIEKIKSGVEAKKVDGAARNLIKKAGYDKYFGHGTGHGIGVYVHVGPSVGPRSEDVLKRGMVVTVEPGIYIPKWGGVRIEDDVYVTNVSGKVLNKAPKNLLEV